MQFEYDAQGNPTAMTDPLGHAETYTYDDNGNLTQFVDRKGQVSQFTYDAMNRRIESGYADGSSTTFTYDAVSRPIQVNDSISGLTQMNYDNLDRLTQELTPQGTVSYGYDAVGRRASMSVNGLTPVTYQYDTATRLTQVAQGSRTVELGYDLAGRRNLLTYPNGTTTNYFYDNASRLIEILHQGPSGIIEDLFYTYDAAGNRISFDRTSSQVNLPQEVQAAYNAANQQVQFNTDTQTYDANGNLTFDGTTTYTWDARNRLVQMSNGSLLASFTYDALGRRISKTINGSTISYLYDGNDIIAEIQNNTVTATYLRGLNIDEPFLRSSAVAEYYHADALGSVLALTDQNGAVQTNYSYDPFGNTTIAGSSSNPFQYTGRENDGTGAYYYRARYYRPTLQRFNSEDPIRYLGGINFYSYVGNNPIIFIDPAGLLRFSWGVGGTLGLIDVNWNSSNPTKTTVSLVTPQLGGGFNFCLNANGSTSVDKPTGVNSQDLQSNRGKPTLPVEAPLEELPFTYSIGNRYLGLSFTDDLSSWCLNLGLAAGPLPVNVAVPLFSF
ncbi:MAG: RHS repeat protein [Nitrospirae bacterium]|nr:RHS repeat protein [Nitrospirota bacterium]